MPSSRASSRNSSSSAAVKVESDAPAASVASKPCLMRLQKEYQRLSKEPLPDVVAEPK